MLVWIKRNLFSTPIDTILTIFCLYLIYLAIPPLLEWGIVNANFTGNSPESCTSKGACWIFIKIRFNQFMYGFYPEEEQWRINLSYIIGLSLTSLLFIPNFPAKKWLGTIILFLYPCIAFVLFYGGSFGLEIVETSNWGGLFLTLVIALTGIVASLPIGILFALGRRSEMPAIKSLSIAFIELWRGVPLISVLFMSSVMLPLFLPPEIYFDKLLRALIGVTLFSSAYMAEVVRGGLQSISQGQYEAAKSLGLGYWKMMYLIILPQALKAVIPGIVNTFIGLFKDTTLVLIIGLFDLLGIVQAASTDPKWLAYHIEGYFFAGLCFWIFCFSMSRYSIYLENKLHTGHKND